MRNFTTLTVLGTEVKVTVSRRSTLGPLKFRAHAETKNWSVVSWAGTEAEALTGVVRKIKERLTK